jgi:hypothetical protein
VDTTEYSFEDIDIEDFHSIRTSGCGVFIVEDGIITDELKETEFGSYTAGYWIGNNTLNITPSPSVATTFTIRYIPTITKIESLTDDLVIPDEYLELVTEELKVRYDKQDEEFDIMQVSDSFAKRYESKLLGDEKYSPSNIQDIRTDFAFRSSFHRI